MDYARLKQSADRLLARVNQGEIEVATVTTAPGATPLDPPTVTTQAERYDGAFRGVSSKYVDGQTILAIDLMGIVEADAPLVVGGLVAINGQHHAVIRVDNIPASGIAVAKRVFVRR